MTSTHAHCRGTGKWIQERAFDADTLLINAPAEWRRHLDELAHAINPNIQTIEFAPTVSITVVVGEVNPAPALSMGNVIWVRADGWVARVHGTPMDWPPGRANPFSSAAAACLAARRVFNCIFGHRFPKMFDEPDVDLSLLNFGASAGAELDLANIDLGHVAIVGLGAVGNGLLWPIKRCAGLRGQLWLVDHEKHELANLQRYVLAMYRDRDRPKTTTCAEALASTPLSVQVRKQRFEEFADTNLRDIAIPTVCVSVDNVPTRRTAQAVLPRLVLNGWTGERSLGVSWHRFEPGLACLACLYHPRGRVPSLTELSARALGLDLARVSELWVKRLPLTDGDLGVVASARGVSFDRVRQFRGKTIEEMYRQAVCGAAGLPMPNGHEEAVPLAHQSALAGVMLAAELVKRLHHPLAAVAQSETLAIWNDVFRPPPRVWVQRCAAERGCICGDPDYRQAFQAKWAASR